MSDSLDRLYLAILAARELDPQASRTARLFQDGQAKIAKKLAEEAIEVAIDAMGGDREPIIRESADLLYNLAVLWAASGIKPDDVWQEIERRERLFGIAEKLPKSGRKTAAGAQMEGGGGYRRAGKLPNAAARARLVRKRRVI